MRLIDADELLKRHGDDIKNFETPYGVMNKSVENAPTIDAEKVVRCNDCKHHFRQGSWCKLHAHGAQRSDFCSFGEAVNAKT